MCLGSGSGVCSGPCSCARAWAAAALRPASSYTGRCVDDSCVCALTCGAMTSWNDDGWSPVGPACGEAMATGPVRRGSQLMGWATKQESVQSIGRVVVVVGHTSWKHSPWTGPLGCLRGRILGAPRSTPRRLCQEKSTGAQRGGIRLVLRWRPGGRS